MKHLSCLVPIAMVGLLGCSDDAATTGSGGATSSTSSSTTTTGTSSTTSASTTGATTSSTSSTGGGNASVTPSIESGTFFIDCMPVVAADPINGSFMASYDNTGTSAGSLTVKAVDLKLSNNGSTLSWSFTVSPGDSGSVPAGQMASVMHQKVAGSGMGLPDILAPCGFCAGKWALDVTWTDGVKDTTLSKDLGNVSCAF